MSGSVLYRRLLVEGVLGGYGCELLPWVGIQRLRSVYILARAAGIFTDVWEARGERRGEQCSQRGSPSVLGVRPGRTTNRSPSSLGDNFAWG